MQAFQKITLTLLCLSFFTACSAPVTKTAYHPNRSGKLNKSSNASTERSSLYQKTGIASWYGPGFYGRKTASGERLTKHGLTCAHRSLPFGTRLEVTHLGTGQTVEVIVNDRGPFHGSRLIDLSYAAAKELGMLGSGSARVSIRAIN